MSLSSVVKDRILSDIAARGDERAGVPREARADPLLQSAGRLRGRSPMSRRAARRARAQGRAAYRAGGPRARGRHDLRNQPRRRAGASATGR